MTAAPAEGTRRPERTRAGGHAIADRLKVAAGAYADLTKLRLNALVAVTTLAGAAAAPARASGAALAAACARTALAALGACAWNEALEAPLDAAMTRTHARPVPAGTISARAASGLGAAHVRGQHPR